MKPLVSLTIILLSLFSCAKSEEPIKNEAPHIVTFTASQSIWENGDQIGIFMLRESASGEWETVVDDNFNRCYQTEGNGQFQPHTPADAIVAPNDGRAVAFVAYYPYNADLPKTTPYLYPLDLSDQADLSNNHFMVSRNLENVMVGGKALTLDFQKQLSEIQINISSEFDAVLLEGVDVMIHGITYNKADYSLLAKENQLINFSEDVAGTKAIVSENGTVAKVTLLANPNCLEAGGRFVFSLKDGREMTYTLDEVLHLEAGKCHTFNVRLQESGSTEDFFELLPQQISNIGVEGGNHQVTLLSKAAWRVKSKPDWVDCTPSQEQGSYKPREVTISVSINNSTEREGEILFEDEKGAIISLALSQKGYDPIGYVANMRYGPTNNALPDVVQCPARDTPSDLLKWRYYTNSVWNAKLVMEPVSWVRFSYETPRLGYLRPGEQATFTLDNNNSSEPREVVVKLVNYDSVLIRVYKIVQLGTIDYLEVNHSKFNSRGKGDKFDFVVASRNDWQVEQIPSWVTLTRGTTSANKTAVTISCAANQGAARSAKIVIRSGELTQTIEVSQNAKVIQKYPYRLPYSAIVHAFAAEDFKFVDGNNGKNNYANTVDITVIPNNGTSIETAKAYGPYGFVVDPPTSKQFKSTEVSGGTMVLSNYSGNATVIREIEISIHYNGWTYIRRAKIFNLPVPAGLTEEDYLVYTIKMTNVKTVGEFNYTISYEIK